MNFQKHIKQTALCALFVTMQFASNAFASGQITPNNSEAPLVQQNITESESNIGTSKPYGYNLFTQIPTQAEPSNSNYKVAVGDRIELRLWGAYTVNESLTVGPDGSIFIPNVGPVHVQGVKATFLNTHIANKVSTVYSNNVKTYARVVTSTPINVFISGSVERPGQYPASSQDSVISLLSLAGGIQAESGSYREIQVIRNNVPIATIDLYRFLKTGYIQNIVFQDRDGIHVTEKGTSISATGATRFPFEFEFKSPQITGAQLMQYATPYPKTSHVAISGIRNSEPFYKYVDINTFRNMPLFDQDKVSFEADQHSDVLGIQVQGTYDGPSFIAVSKGTRLLEVLSLIPVDPQLSDIKSVYLKRRSTAEQQQKNLDDSLFALEKSIRTAPARSDAEARIRTQEAALVQEFVDKAKQIKPDGRIVVSENGEVQNILLEEGDVIVIPSVSDIVLINGEVISEQSLVFNEKYSAKDYVEKSGGFTERADKKKILIVKRNGEVIASNKTNIEAGDSIVVLPKIDSKYLQFGKDLTQILFQIAVAAKAF